MTIVPDAVWQQVEEARPSGDELVARQALPSLTDKVLVAVDARGRRHVLVALSGDDEPFREKGSRGLTTETRDLALADHAATRYITLRCEDVAGHSMLDLIGGEIAEQVASVAGTPAEIVSKVLARWRRFWGQLPTQILTYEEQIGLFSELWFLAYWLIPAVGPREALSWWRGPMGARHDFEQTGLSIEAKGTASIRGRVFSVGSINQLEPPESGQLLLFGMRVREEGGASNTLPALVNVCRELASAHGDAEGALETALISVGYVASHEDEYAKVRWRVVEDVLFDVRSDFPRLTPASFSGGLPAGVEEVEFSINLGGFDHLIVAQTPSEAASLLQAANGPE